MPESLSGRVPEEKKFESLQERIPVKVKLNIVPKEIVAKYRAILGNALGKEILVDMLIELGVFAQLETEQDITRHNYGIELLACLGVLKPDENGVLPKKNVELIVDALLGAGRKE